MIDCLQSCSNCFRYKVRLCGIHKLPTCVRMLCVSWKPKQTCVMPTSLTRKDSYFEKRGNSFIPSIRREKSIAAEYVHKRSVV